MKNKALLAALSFWSLIACRTASETDAVREQQSSSTEQPAQQEQPVGYEKGEWWDHDINSLMIAGSHILIAHRDSKLTKQMVSGAISSRTREEARRKAWSLYETLRAHPERFADVARKESDDPATAWVGGSLGLFYALQVPEQLVDAFGHMAIGEVSRPVETAQGYHLVRSAKPLPEVELSMAHIVIKYDGAFGWRRLDRPIPSRTRLQARELAGRVALEARRHPERFGRLALQYSDGDDALRDGDMGLCSTYEDFGSDFMLLSIASQLPIGGISEVIETNTGAHVLLRKPPVAKKRVATSTIVIGYKGSQLSLFDQDGKRSKQEAKKLANKIAEELKRRPRKFEQLRATYCDKMNCEDVLSWYVGRGIESFERELTNLEVNEISTTSVDSPVGYVILRREDPQGIPIAPRPKPRFNFIPLLYADENE